MVSVSLSTSFSSANLPQKPFKVRRPSPETSPSPPPYSPSPAPLLSPPAPLLSPPAPLRNLTPSLRSSNPNPLSSKLWLSSKLSPPPPPPRRPPEPEQEPEPGTLTLAAEDEQPPAPPNAEFRQKGKIFVGNLPLWAKKSDISEFFRQFGPLDKVELIRGHEDPERNVGYCFVYYGGAEAEAERAAERAVEFDGVEFHGRVLTVRLDDGRRRKAKAEERMRWVEGDDRREFRSTWHEGRDKLCLAFRRVLDSQPENWQAVVSAFERIPKVNGFIVNFDVVKLLC